MGLALFITHRFLSGGEPGPTRDIVVSAAQVESLAENFQKSWMRPPTTEKLSRLVDDHIAEVYNRDAVAVGIDRDDQVIRRRLPQKVEFMSDSVMDSVERTDAQLEQFMHQHAAKFAMPERFILEQVFISTERRGSLPRRPHVLLPKRLPSSVGRRR